MAGKLIIKIIIFITLIGVFSFLAMFINPDYDKEYIAGISPKLEKLKSAHGNKIVIIGGSNGSFGIDSQLMEKKLGVSVVNMALHGGLPLKYVIEQVKEELNKGDILILTKEYGGLKSQYWNRMNGIELPKIVTYDLSQIKVLLTDKTLFVSTLTGLFKTINFNIKRFPFKRRKNLNSVYSINAFYKDNLKAQFLEGSYEKKISIHTLPKLNVNSKLIESLQYYHGYFKKEGIDFYITPPVIIEGYYDAEQLLPFWRYFSNITNIPLLSNNKPYVLPREYFLNSHYHTNYKGREKRTKSLIEDIVNSDASITK
ncbi:hypothetical protein [Maribacter sp. IgM3_T14_3]|uniref:hypothetical protein n=1 Tax=Maribacter sp. IgM3_T14_3 TaxID=3415140 RepID=UPI003C6FFEFA